MRIEKYGCAAVALCFDDVANQSAAHRIEARRRLIEKQQLRFVNQRLGKPDALQHSLGKIPKLPITVLRQPNYIELGIHAMLQIGSRNAIQAAVQTQQLSGGEPVVEPEMFRKEADSRSRLPVCGRAAQELRFATGRFNKIEQHLYRGALPCPVGAQEAEDLTAANIQREASNCDLIGKHFSQTTRRDGKLGGRGIAGLIWFSNAGDGI
jgi:hypothetical protein